MGMEEERGLDGDDENGFVWWRGLDEYKLLPGRCRDLIISFVEKLIPEMEKVRLVGVGV